MTALLPALLCALFACWSGTFHGGASWLGALAGDVAVLAFALLAAPRLRDPLRLGPGSELLPWALLAAVAASTLASPVPRAGLERLALLPAFLLVPPAIEHVWRDPERRRIGWRSLALVAGCVASWSLVDAVSSGSLRAAAPLGHHGALSVWLIFLLPFAALGMRDRGAWRWVGGLATAIGVAALLTSRSLAGAALLAVQAAMLLRGRLRGWAMAVFVSLVGLNALRLIAIVTGADPSIAARGAYFAAAFEGMRARLALGWGPGSVGLTIGEHLRAAPGLNPPGEVVSYLHFLPFDLGYQVGIPGTLLAAAVAAAFLIAVRNGRSVAADPPLLDAATASLVPGLVALGVAGFQPLGATVSAAAIAAGAALAARGRELRRGEPSHLGTRLAVLAYVAVALGVLLPVRLAQRHYDRARVAERPLPLLVAATEHDRPFPLYTARRAWVAGFEDPGSATSAAGALRAAERAPGVAALWLAAGLLGAESGAPWSDAALRRACDLDPLGALAPFRLATLAPAAGGAPRVAARALLAEPLLAAATDWGALDDLYHRAVVEAGRWRGVDPRWRGGLVAALQALPTVDGGPIRPLFLEIDAQPETSLSLFVFRRLPWRTSLGAIDLRVERLRRVAPLGSAARRRDTEPWAFASNGCGGAEPPR